MFLVAIVFAPVATHADELVRASAAVAQVLQHARQVFDRDAAKLEITIFVDDRGT
jgi:hypothetical protein